MDELTNNKIRFTPIAILSIFSFILWQLPYSNVLLFPLKMFVTYIHESSHGLAAIITGGSLIRFEMALDTSGLAYTSGGIRTLIVSAGYIGSTFWGALLLIASIRKTSENKILNGLSLFFLLFTLFFARNSVAFLSGLFFSIGMFYIAKIKNKKFLNYFLTFLAIQVCFQSFQDIISLFLLSGTGIITDAHIISAELTGNFVHPVIFALSWGIISIFIFISALRLSVKKL